MPEPQDMAEGVGNLFQTGLGIFNRGINGIADVLQSADSAVKALDTSLTGQKMGNPSGGGNVPEGLVANQVVTLVRQGRDAASQTGNAQSPGAVRGFQQAMAVLFQHDMPAVNELANMMPSPTEVVQMGLRDLRGSTSLARLAQGGGTMEDVAQVAQFTEELVGRVQQTMVRPQPEAPARKRLQRRTSNHAANPSNGTANPDNKAPKQRRSRKKKETTLAQQSPPEGDIALAQAVAEVMDDDTVNGWFKEFEQGTIPEEEWVGRIGAYAHKRGMDGLDGVLEQANARLGDVMARRASAQS